MKIEELYKRAIDLLQNLIKTPSFSKEEDQTAVLIENWLKEWGIKTYRSKNNIWAKNMHFDATKPTILLNSHHDTVHPNKGYTRDPHQASIENGKLFGLGSNDAGGCLVSLMSTFTYFYKQENLAYNLIITATAEEEIAGQNGIKDLLTELPPIDFAIVGEPTEMHLAIAEKGLLVIDGVAQGKSGHAAHDNTENAIYNALDDIQWIRQFEFQKETVSLGKVKMTVSVIQAGKQHNVVPADCSFVIDVRVNDAYSNKEVFEIIDAHTKSDLKARSFRLNSSSIPKNHPIVLAGLHLNRKTYGSPTLSDQAMLSCPSLKLGPGNSLRSHQANEFIFLNEIENGIKIYVDILNQIL